MAGSLGAVLAGGWVVWKTGFIIGSSILPGYGTAIGTILGYGGGFLYGLAGGRFAGRMYDAWSGEPELNNAVFDGKPISSARMPDQELQADRWGRDQHGPHPSLPPPPRSDPSNSSGKPAVLDAAGAVTGTVRFRHYRRLRPRMATVVTATVAPAATRATTPATRTRPGTTTRSARATTATTGATTATAAATTMAVRHRTGGAATGMARIRHRTATAATSTTMTVAATGAATTTATTAATGWCCWIWTATGSRSTCSRQAAFDMDGDGYLERTPWASADDGFLVIELDADGEISSTGGDGVIDRADELVFSRWGTPGMTDLQALAEACDADGNRVFDTDVDGALTSADAVWGSMKLFQDLDGDGSVDAGELRTLKDWAITRINLAYGDGSSFSETDDDRSALGVTLHGLASYVRNGKLVENGLGDVSLAYERLGWRRVETESGWLDRVRGRRFSGVPGRFGPGIPGRRPFGRRACRGVRRQPFQRADGGRFIGRRGHFRRKEQRPRSRVAAATICCPAATGGTPSTVAPGTTSCLPTGRTLFPPRLSRCAVARDMTGS